MEVDQPEPGRFVWHSPLGGEYRTRGEFLLSELPETAPSDPSPWPERTPRTTEGPICAAHHPLNPPHRPPRPSITPTSRHSDQTDEPVAAMFE